MKDICDKVSDEHFEAMKVLQGEKRDLVDKNGKLGLDFRDLQTRNRRQEDFIFTIQAKVDKLEAQNSELCLQIEEMQKAKEAEAAAEAASNQEEEVVGPEFRAFGSQTDPVKVS